MRNCCEVTEMGWRGKKQRVGEVAGNGTTRAVPRRHEHKQWGVENLTWTIWHRQHGVDNHAQVRRREGATMAKTSIAMIPLLP